MRTTEEGRRNKRPRSGGGGGQPRPKWKNTRKNESKKRVGGTLRKSGEALEGRKATKEKATKRLRGETHRGGTKIKKAPPRGEPCTTGLTNTMRQNKKTMGEGEEVPGGGRKGRNQLGKM